MDNTELKSKTFSGLAWKLVENFGFQLVAFITQIVLARLLMPENYGIIALTIVFVSIANVFVQTGFSSALIQKESVNEIEYSSVFFAGMILSVSLYLVLYTVAPHISAFYSEPSLNLVLRIQSLSIILAGFSSVQNAIIARDLEFKKVFWYKMVAVLFQGGSGILLALLGFGVWALVISNIIYSTLIALSLWIVVKWRPKFLFSFSSLKNIFPFSSRLLLMNLLNNLTNSFKSLIIGKSFDSTSLGFFNRGNSIPTLLMVNIDGAISSVMFSSLSKCQNDKERFITAYRRSISTSVYIIFPIMLGLVVIAEPLTIVLLTEKWLPSVPFLRISSIICMTWPFALSYHAFNAMGKSDVSLKLNILSIFVTLILMFASIQFGVYAVVFSSLIGSLVWMVAGVYLLKRIIGYDYRHQFYDVIPSFLLSLAMAGIVYASGTIINGTIAKLFIQISLGVGLYLGGSFLLKIEPFRYLLNIFLQFVNEHRSNQQHDI
jgi:O-antigen/teichoic acid export membrane protein